MSLIVITVAVPDRAGSSKMQASFAEALVQSGHQVRVLHGPPGRDVDGNESSFLAEQRAAGIETCLVPGLRRPVPYLIYRQLAPAAAGADLVVGFQQRDRAAAMKLAADLQVPGVVAAQNQHRFSGPALTPWLKRSYYSRRLDQGMRLAVCTSSVVRDEMVSFFDVPQTRCVVLPNGVAPSEQGDERRHAAEVEEFIAVGRLDEQKGYDTLLRAWARADLPERCRLRIVGGATAGNRSEISTNHAAHLRALAEELGIDTSVIFHGDSDEVPELLSKADAFVHSAHWEGPPLPLAVLEAMNAELPVIATDCSGPAPGFEQDVHGLMVAAESVEEMSNALQRMSSAPAHKRQQLGRAARDLASTDYHIDVISERFIRLLESLLDG